MSLKSEYIEKIKNVLITINPQLKKEGIEDIIDSIIKERMKDPTVVIDNNVTGENHEISLIKLCNWLDNNCPVISGNATFYVQPSVLLSPTSNMLKSLKLGRKATKKKMFQYKEGSDEYLMLDLDQNNQKVIMNAEYGGSGAPTAAFYTKYSPAATTLMAQSIITVMAAFFESFVGDNQKFYNINECFDWIDTICKKKTDKIPKWVKRKTYLETFDRLVPHFMEVSINDLEVLKKYLSNKTTDELTYIYYINNLKNFIKDHKEMKDLFFNILSKMPHYEASAVSIPEEFKDKFPPDNGNELRNYNKWVASEMFLDPYTVPPLIKEEIDIIKNYISKMVFLEYLTPDSIVKLNNHKRNTILLVDTDSNMIYVNPFIELFLKELFPGNDFGRGLMYNEMILINILATVLDGLVKHTLDYYGRTRNMDEASRAELTMKNEFMFKVFFLMLTKKRYVASVLLREGNIMLPMLTEIKGMDFIKAGVSIDVEKRFRKILEDNIILSDEINLRQMMSDLRKFEKDIFKDLKEGGITYLKQQQFKDGGYKNMSSAWSLPVFRGTMVWNELYPTKKINSFDIVAILKTTVSKVEDIEFMKEKYPEDYKNIIKSIYSNEFKEIRDASLKYICIPKDIGKLPDWMLDIIDYNVIISDVISSFKSVTQALKIEDIGFKTPNGKATISSGLISI